MVEEAPTAPVGELDVWSVLTNIDELLPEGHVVGQTVSKTWEEMSEVERTRAEEDGASFRRFYQCNVNDEGMSTVSGTYGLFEADDAASAVRLRDFLLDESSGEIRDMAYADTFITGRYCVIIMWPGEDSEPGETLFSNLKSAVGYEE